MVQRVKQLFMCMTAGQKSSDSIRISKTYSYVDCGFQLSRHDSVYGPHNFDHNDLINVHRTSDYYKVECHMRSI